MPHHPSTRFLLALSVPFAALAAPLSAAVCFWEDFESGSLSKWTQAHAYYITDDPLQVGDRAMSSPGGASRTTLARATRAISAHSGGLAFSYQVYVGEAHANWQAKVLLGTSASVNSPGYGFIVGATSISLRRADGGYGGWAKNADTVTLASQALVAPPLLSNQWNTVSFEWLEDGALSLRLNGVLVLTATDTTYAPKTGRLDLENFLNNSATEADRVLLFDDVTLAPAEPSRAKPVVASPDQASRALAGKKFAE